MKCLLDYYKIQINKISPIKININKNKNFIINKQNDRQNSLRQISKIRKLAFVPHQMQMMKSLKKIIV